MKLTYPIVYMIASTQLHPKAVTEWLEDLGGLKVLDSMAGSDPEQLIELAARRCYKSFDVGLNPNITKVRKNSEEYHTNIMKQRHGSVLVHATVSFAFEEVSRIFTHEVVRNSVGNAISQESLKYVRLSNVPIWIPAEIEEDSAAYAKVTAHIQDAEELQLWLARHYKIDEMQDFDKKKKFTSTFRRFAPMGLSTGMVMTFNIRSLRWVIEQRTERHAEVEIRMVFNMVAKIAKAEWPFLFADFVEVPGPDNVPEWKPLYSKV